MARKPRKPASTNVTSTGDNVPGISSNPATNLLMADIAMRAGTSVLRAVVEKRLLKGRYGTDTAREIVSNRSMKHTIASVAVAKLATKSTPGAVLIGGGLVAKTLFDRSRKRRAAKRAGDAKLLERAKDS